MRQSARVALPAAVVVSLLLTLIRPFSGTGAGLALALLLQIGLPGVLLARALRLQSDPHPIVRFVWVLACGLGLTVVLGGVLRYLNVSVPFYLLALHAVMLALAFVPPPAASAERWHLKRSSVQLYVLLAVACIALLWAGYSRSRVHFEMEVPTVYTAQVTWLAAEADHFATPDRWIGAEAVSQAGSRARLDGWTYIQAAWAWASGIPAAQLLWHDVTPLFIPTIPLIAFATAYVLTRRESVGAWSAAAVALFALMTLDTLIFPGSENTLYYGAQAVYLDTVRGASTILVVPLAIFALISYLAAPGRRAVVPLLLLGHALALMRVRQIFILEVVALGTLAVWWLAAPARRVRAALLLLVVLVSFAVLPFQMYLQPTLQGSVYLSEKTDTTLDAGRIVAAPADRVYVLEGLHFRVLRGLPVIGDTFIIDPLDWFYTPLIGAAMLVGLAAVWRWKRSLAAQYLFGTTAAITVLVFLPGVTALYTRIFGSVASVNLIAGLNYALPVGLGLGVAVGWLLDRLKRIPYVSAAAALAMSAALLLTLFEPLSLIHASARDQIDAMNSAQSMLDIAPFDEQLVADVRETLDPAQTARILTSERTGGFLVESLPNVFVPGWESPAVVLDATRRFVDGATPFVDAADVQFMADESFTHVIVRADSAAVPQLLLQPERYERLLDSSGFLVFRLVNPPQVDEADRLFSQMNDLLAAVDLPRWRDGEFALARSADPAPWEALAAAWRDQLARQPGDLARYGLAMTALLMNRDDEALPIWQALDEAHPDVPLFADALAYTLHQSGSADPKAPLLRNLDGDSACVRVLAARTLLTETFFYSLEPAQLERVLAVTRADAPAWSALAEWQRPNDIRQRAALLMSAKQYEGADTALAQIARLEIRPSDLVARAAIRLLRGDLDGALAVLQPATDADWVTIRSYLHPDRWEPRVNSAAQAYDRLRAGDPNSLLALSEPDAGMIMHPRVEVGTDALTISADFGSFVPAYAPQTWRALVVSPDAAIQYGAVEISAQGDQTGFTSAALTVPLPPDLPPLTPARVIVQSLYSDALVYETRLIDTVLNRPLSAQIPAAAVASGLRFGDHITLQAYTAALDDQGLDVSLYWQTDAPLTTNYQVFVHVVSADGQSAAQQDAAPVDNHYPTSSWLLSTVIEDRHLLPLDLPSGEYRVYVGLYGLVDLTRLPVTPASEIVESDAVRIFTFTVS